MKIILILFLVFGNISGFYKQLLENQDESPILYIEADRLPKLNYNGGIEKYIWSNLKWPYQMDIEGTVLVSFIINKTGKIENIKIEKGLDQKCDEEVVRVLQEMPLWEPGEKDSKVVDILLYYPVKFFIKGKYKN
jgi:TonB family protein